MPTQKQKRWSLFLEHLERRNEALDRRLGLPEGSATRPLLFVTRAEGGGLHQRSA